MSKAVLARSQQLQQSRGTAGWAFCWQAGGRAGRQAREPGQAKTALLPAWQAARLLMRLGCWAYESAVQLQASFSRLHVLLHAMVQLHRVRGRMARGLRPRNVGAPAAESLSVKAWGECKQVQQQATPHLVGIVPVGNDRQVANCRERRGLLPCCQHSGSGTPCLPPPPCVAHALSPQSCPASAQGRGGQLQQTTRGAACARSRLACV